MKIKYNIIAAFLIWGCHSQTNSSTANTAATHTDTVKHSSAKVIPIGKGMTDTVVCTEDPTQKYAIYVPSNYSDKKKWPVIYFFDPHGNGNLPLTIYKNLAERYGYIIAGTYNSKNGMKWPESEKAAQAFMQDSWQKLAIDNNRVYTFGFSGGARVASSVAIIDGGVAGVAACGGGFSERNPNIRQPFAFIGFVGNRDFNYIELKQLDKELETSPLQHELVVYNGKHQWPPEPIAEAAFQWFEVSAMKMHFIPKNDSLVKVIEQKFFKAAEKAQKQNKEVDEYYAYKDLINYLGNVTDVSKYDDKLKILANSDKVQKYMRDEQTDEQQEMQVQSDFINYLSDKDIDWWQSTVKQMREYIKKDSTSPVAAQNQRLLSYLSLASYMGSSQAFRSQNDAATSHFLTIYNLVDPTNPEHSYLYACMYARENENDKAISSLNDAVRLGFNDLHRLQQDSNFVALRGGTAFKELEKKIQNMPPKVDMTQ
jgi:poly(3-hydroxybutyrate) depolymerase